MKYTTPINCLQNDRLFRLLEIYSHLYKTNCYAEMCGLRNRFYNEFSRLNLRITNQSIETEETNVNFAFWSTRFVQLFVKIILRTSWEIMCIGDIVNLVVFQRLFFYAPPNPIFDFERFCTWHISHVWNCTFCTLAPKKTGFKCSYKQKILINFQILFLSRCNQKCKQ